MQHKLRNSRNYICESKHNIESTANNNTVEEYAAEICRSIFF